MYKVFINDTVFWLGFNLEKTFFNKKFSFTTCYTVQEFDFILNSKVKEEVIIVNFPTLKVLNKLLEKKFRIVEAGGGLVVNEKEEILFIFRKGRWDLPKGKLEKREKIKHGAIREVEEECGITEPKIREDLITTFHKFRNKGSDCIKKTYWYIMDYDKNEELIPQKEEGITKVKWIHPDKLEKVFKNTFPSIKDVLEAYLLRINS